MLVENSKLWILCIVKMVKFEKLLKSMIVRYLYLFTRPIVNN